MGKPVPLRKLRKLRIAFFAPNDFEYVQRLAAGILRYRDEHGGCVIRDYRYDPKAPEDGDAWAKRQHPWTDWQPDGIIGNFPADPGLPEWVERSGVPTVNTASSYTPLPSVHLSPDGIARVALEHLEPLGFTHFAYVACDLNDQRAPAFERRLNRKGRSLHMINFGSNPAHWEDETESQLASSAELVDLLRATPKPLAVLASTDQVGRVVCRAAQDLGFKIPEEVGVLGINNFSICETCDPPLSSIHAPGDDVSYRAMELLIALLTKGEVPPHCVQIQPGKVYSRASTAATLDREADIARGLEIMRERALSGINVDEVVEELNMSRSTFYRECVAATGRTPAEEIARIRLERAKELLAKTKVPIIQIADMFGYESPANFTHFFKGHTGMTPRAYRKKHHEIAARASDQPAR